MLTKTLCSGAMTFLDTLGYQNKNPVPRIDYLSLSSCQWGPIDCQHYYNPLRSSCLPSRT